MLNWMFKLVMDSRQIAMWYCDQWYSPNIFLGQMFFNNFNHQPTTRRIDRNADQYRPAARPRFPKKPLLYHRIWRSPTCENQIGVSQNWRHYGKVFFGYSKKSRTWEDALIEHAFVTPEVRNRMKLSGLKCWWNLESLKNILWTELDLLDHLSSHPCLWCNQFHFFNVGPGRWPLWKVGDRYIMVYTYHIHVGIDILQLVTFHRMFVHQL